MSFRVSLFYLSVIISFGLSVFLSVSAHLNKFIEGRIGSIWCLFRWFGGFVGEWDWWMGRLSYVGHRSLRSTFGAKWSETCMISLTVVLFDCGSDHCFLKLWTVLILSLSVNWVISLWRVHQENTKALTGNTSKGFQVEKQSASRVAKRSLAPVATPVGFCATLKPTTQSLPRLE